MNKKTLAIIITVLAVAVGAIVFVAVSKDEMGNLAQQTVTNNTKPPQSEQNKTEGTFVDYSDSVVANTKGTKILFFHAPWCPQCRALERSIKEGQIPAGVTIIKVDYDSNQQLRQQYGVAIQTTLVKVDDQGNLIKKFVAYDNPSLDSLRSNLL